MATLHMTVYVAVLAILVAVILGLLAFMLLAGLSLINDRREWMFSRRARREVEKLRQAGWVIHTRLLCLVMWPSVRELGLTKMPRFSRKFIITERSWP